MAEGEKGLLKWLTNIVSACFVSSNHEGLLTVCVQDQFGFSFISGVPPTPEATEKLAERIGFIRETQCKRPELSIYLM